MRYVLAVLGLLVLVAGLAGVKGKQIANLIAVGKQYEKSGPPPEAVSTTPAREQAWEGTLSAVGSVVAVRGVAVSNDAPGTVVRIDFESGAFVKQGHVLVALDTSVERAQLASAHAREGFAAVSAKRTRSLVQSGSLAAAQLDADESALDGASADVGALAAQIERKIVRAPFSGRLGIRMINLGQYLSPGTQITVLEVIDSVYVDFTLPQQRLDSLKTGMPVRVHVAGGDGPPLDGVISAIDPSVDTMTRTIKLRASVPNKDEQLRPGMFANVSVVLPDQGKVVAVPATAVVHASYGDSLFVVENEVARQQFVRLGQTRGDFVAILDGVTAGQNVVSAGAFKLRNGAHVAIKSDVELDLQLAPHPTNR